MLWTVQAKQQARRQAAPATGTVSPSRELSAAPAKACFDFKQSRCSRGDSCRFSHDPDVLAAAAGRADAAAARLEVPGKTWVRGFYQQMLQVASSDTSDRHLQWAMGTKARIEWL